MICNIFMWIKAVIILVVTTRLWCMPAVSINSNIDEIQNLNLENANANISLFNKTFRMQNNDLEFNLKNMEKINNDSKILKPSIDDCKINQTLLKNLVNTTLEVNKNLHKNDLNKSLVFIDNKLNTTLKNSAMKLEMKPLNNNNSLIHNEEHKNVDTNLQVTKNKYLKHEYVKSMKTYQNTKEQNKQCNAQNSVLSNEEIETVIKVLSTILHKNTDDAVADSSSIVTRDLHNNKRLKDDVSTTKENRIISNIYEPKSIKSNSTVANALDKEVSRILNTEVPLKEEDKTKNIDNNKYNHTSLQPLITENASQFDNVSRINERIDIESSTLSEYQLSTTQSNINDSFVLDTPLTLSVENTTEFPDIFFQVDSTISSLESFRNSPEKSIKYDVVHDVTTTENYLNKNNSIVYESSHENIIDLIQLNQTDVSKNFTVKPKETVNNISNMIQPSILFNNNENFTLKDIKILKSSQLFQANNLLEKISENNVTIPQEKDALKMISNHTLVHILENSSLNNSSNIESKNKVKFKPIKDENSKVKIETNKVETITTATNDDSIQKLTFRFHVPVDGVFKFNCTKNTITIKNGIAQFEIYIKKN